MAILNSPWVDFVPQNSYSRFFIAINRPPSRLFIYSTSKDSKVLPGTRPTCRSAGRMGNPRYRNASYENKDSEALACRRESRNVIALDVFRRA